MFPTLPESTQAELTRLAQDFDQPIVHIADLSVRKLFNPLHNQDRFGEVCMVVRRPNGRLLTMKKDFYPPDAYRLPTGGINYGENVLDALLRETHEETGLQVSVRRFLAAAADRVVLQDVPPTPPVFYTFAFLLDETGGTLSTIDEDERIEGFREIEVDDLPARAAYFDGLREQYSEAIEGDWGDWGRFRSVIHRLVWQALSQ
jgi:8-oxo-dGTP pyrophosphatase MutT (NUDIX family)